ncbi:hypothetical protein SB87_gp113 [Parapoxvirus red deer/HL953]|uniref:Chemokine binding protein n=1 Tax=Parapoxvirus red deer/HL953 TaxID=1579460 RepID=A0A0A7MEV9_9POXV|nr:hypothetical protein SB87_gp113 [Parapoxvirus red deer/HL953]AIZ77366.1 hypothetical protein [Parapoxvirus red deer/HL953]
MKTLLLAAVIISLANSLPLLLSNKDAFCSSTKEEIHPQIMIAMRINRTVVSEPKTYCELDMQDDLLEGTFMDSTAYFEANGVNATVSIMGEGIDMTLSSLRVEYTPTTDAEIMYAFISSWAPWVKNNKDLALNNREELANFTRNLNIALKVDCDHQKFPVPTTEAPTPTPPTTESPTTTTISVTETRNETTPSVDEEDDEEPPVDVHTNRKHEPMDISFSTMINQQCIQDLAVRVVIRDACEYRKTETPLGMLGTHGNDFRQELKKMKTKRTCSMHLKNEETVDEEVSELSE